MLLHLGSPGRQGLQGLDGTPGSSLTPAGLPWQPVGWGRIPLLKLVLQHPLHLLNHLGGRGRGRAGLGLHTSPPWLAPGWLTLALPSPGAVWSPPAPSPSAACPGAASAAQPVAAEPGTREEAPSLGRSSGGGGGVRGESGKEGCLGVTLGLEASPQAPLLSPALVAPSPLSPSPFCSQMLLCRLPPQFPMFSDPQAPSSLESARSVDAAPCPSASSRPAHSAAVSVSWILWWGQVESWLRREASSSSHQHSLGLGTGVSLSPRA